MSAITRALIGHTVRYRTASGTERTGLMLALRSSYALVGVQDEKKPYTYVYNSTHSCMVMTPNNAIWAVPYDCIISAESRANHEGV